MRASGKEESWVNSGGGGQVHSDMAAAGCDRTKAGLQAGARMPGTLAGMDRAQGL